MHARFGFHRQQKATMGTQPIFQGSIAAWFRCALRTLLLCIVLAEPPAAKADDLIDALAAYSVLKFDKSFPDFLSLAHKGVRDAQTRLGSMYLHGEGVSVDLREAAKWLERASEQGSSEAPMQLAEALTKIGTPEAYKTAIYWLRRASDRSIGEANTVLGELYLFGLGTPQDYSGAIEWFNKGAQAFDTKAFYYLGLCFSSGLGVDRDEVEAAKWFELAWRTSLVQDPEPEVLNGYLISRERLMPSEAKRATQGVADWIVMYGGYTADDLFARFR
jgi:Sel1 repeat